MTPEVWKAAEALAEAILDIHAIREARSALQLRNPKVEVQAKPTVSDIENLIGILEDLQSGKVLEEELLAEMEPEDDGEFADVKCLLRTMTETSREMRRLEEYERKAYSRYRKLITRLDYATVEAQRRSR